MFFSSRYVVVLEVVVFFFFSGGFLWFFLRFSKVFWWFSTPDTGDLMEFACSKIEQPPFGEGQTSLRITEKRPGADW